MRSAPSDISCLQIPFLVLIGHPGWSQYLALIPFECAVANCDLSTVNCEVLSEVPRTGPKLAKSVEAMGETREVMLEKAVLRSANGPSKK